MQNILYIQNIRLRDIWGIKFHANLILFDNDHVILLLELKRFLYLFLIICHTIILRIIKFVNL